MCMMRVSHLPPERVEGVVEEAAARVGGVAPAGHGRLGQLWGRAIHTLLQLPPVTALARTPPNYPTNRTDLAGQLLHVTAGHAALVLERVARLPPPTILLLLPLARVISQQPPGKGDSHASMFNHPSSAPTT